MENLQNTSMSLARPDTQKLSAKLKWALAVGSSGLFILLLAMFNTPLANHGVLLAASLSLISVGVVLYANELYLKKSEGIKNDGVWFNALSSRGAIGWVVGVVLTMFYVVLYFYPHLLGLGAHGAKNTGLIALFDPLSHLLSGGDASQWFVYGTLYTLAILLFGFKFMLKYRGNRYQQLRTLSVMFFQFGFAFLIPELMAGLNSTSNLPYYDLKNMWPLNYYNFEQYRVDGFISAGNMGMAFLIFGIVSIFVISPFLTYKYGKRWYCSWVCGCGGLAETAGDPFRHLSSKTLASWKIERWLIHLVLVFVVLMTTAVVLTYLETDSSKYWLTKDVFLVLVGLLLTTVFTLSFFAA